MVVILISGNLNIQNAIEAMRRGAFDYVTKPFNLSDVEVAVHRALKHQAVLKANRRYEQHLEEMVSLRTRELSRANGDLNSTLERLYINYRATLRSLAAALEARDVETKGHSERVVAYCLRLGRQLGPGQQRFDNARTRRVIARHREDRGAGRDPPQARLAHRR